jgi:hypothetical protein
MSGEPELTDAPGFEPAPEEPAAPPQEAVAPPVEDDAPEAVEISPGIKMVPVSAVIALRKELKAAKPLADKATALESELNQLRPYAEFVRANPQLLERQQPVAPPQTPPSQDPELITYARRLDLYDAQGQPDVTRAAEIRDMVRKDAAMAAAEMVRPVVNQTHEERAAANLNSVLGQKDAHGRPIAADTVKAVVGQLASGLRGHPNAQAELSRLLADPQVIQLVADRAFAEQSRSGRPAPQAPLTPALEVESAGGSGSIVLGDGSRRLMKDAGISEKDAVESAKRYRPGRANVLE